MVSVRELSPGLQEMAIKELNENPATRAEDIEHIREWILQQPHLRSRTDDQFILNMLRLCKFSKQKTKERIDLFYTIKTMVSEMTFNRDPFKPEVIEILDLGLFLPLRQAPYPDGPKIGIVRANGLDLTKHSIEAIIHVAVFFVETLFEEDDSLIVCGQRAMADLENLTMQHAMMALPYINRFRKLAGPLQKLFMFRPHGYHVINANSVFEMLFQSVKHLVNDKHLQKMKFYHDDNIKELYDDIPLSILPKDYGGDGDTLEELKDYWKKKILSNVELYKREDQYGVEERLRPGKSPYVEEESSFGADGSFKRIEID